MYLDDEVANSPYQVVDYRDHFPQRRRYFHDYNSALNYFTTRIGIDDIGSYTGSVAVIRTADGFVLNRKSWRIML